MSEVEAQHRFQPAAAIAAAGLLLASVFTPVFATPPGSESSAQSRFIKAGDGREAESKYLLRLPLHSDSQKEKGETAGSVTFVGTATVLIRYGGLTVLTDPNFLHRGDHVHLGYGLTSERLTNPAIELEDLPPIDLIVLSHMHEDHFDKFVQKNLDRNIPVVPTEKAAESLKELGFRKLYPLKTWAALLVEKGNTTLRVTATPARHGPAVVAKLLPEVMGSMLDFGDRIPASVQNVYQRRYNGFR